jgi:hypothetical protein
MNDPTRRDFKHAEAREEDERRQGGADTHMSAELAAIGGEPLEGSGFEEEEPEKEFL